MKNSESKNSKITKKELNHVFWRSFQMEFSWNYERQMNMAYVYAMIPILKKLYQSKEEMAAALKRHLEFFNTTPHIVTLILGITAAMEEENKDDPEFDVTAIDSIKTSLMGPLAGLGDSFFWGTLRLIATGVGTSLAMQGNILGPILFILIFNIPHILFRYLATGWGYRLGTGFLKKIQGKRDDGKFDIRRVYHWVDGRRSNDCHDDYHQYSFKNRFRRKCCDCSKYF